MVIINLKIKIMETKLEINSLEALRAALIQRIGTLYRRCDYEDGWVIAGYGGETLYAYVGLGCGYMGACLAPCSITPLVYDTEDDAKLFVQKMDYKNGRLERIHLRAWKACSYYKVVIAELEKSIKAIDSL